MINKQYIIEINKNFSNGRLINQSSLDFALSYSKTSKDWIKQLAYLVRSILLDHVFEEGNKRTAAALICAFIEFHNLAYDAYKVDTLIIEILTKKINNINKIRRIIKNVIR
jgi:prophage maintenance system killer protein